MRTLPNVTYKLKPDVYPESLGFSRYALRFDGAEDHVDITGVSTSGDFSVLFWMKRSTLDTGSEVWALDSATGRFILAVDDHSGAFPADTLRVYDGDWNTSSTTTPEERWVPVGFVLHSAASEADLYVDGLFQETLAAFNTIGGDTMIGSKNDGLADFYPGLSDNWLIINRALTPQEVLHATLNYHNPPGNGLEMWLPMEEGTGTTAEDGSGEGNDGTLLPAGDPPTWVRAEKWGPRSQGGL